MTDNVLIPSDFVDFNDADIKRAGELLGCLLDKASCVKSLIYQRDTGLSIARGEINIVSFGGKPTVMINKQGYLSYAARQPDYDGYESGIEEVNGTKYAWCIVYSKSRSHPTKVRISEKEFAKATATWKSMPEYMLEKTAISLALRAAFPIGLNGTYSEEEIPDAEPFKVEARPTDILVKPTPKPEPIVADAPVLSEKDICTMQYAQMILENMTEKGMDISVFDSAKLPDGRFNKKMIEESFYSQQKAAKAQTESKPEPQPVQTAAQKENKTTSGSKQTKPTSEKDDGLNFVCQNCGAAISKIQHETSQMFIGKHLCQKCMNLTHKA